MCGSAAQLEMIGLKKHCKQLTKDLKQSGITVKKERKRGLGPDMNYAAECPDEIVRQEGLSEVAAQLKGVCEGTAALKYPEQLSSS